MVEMGLNGASWRCLESQACSYHHKSAVQDPAFFLQGLPLPGTEVGPPYVQTDTLFCPPVSLLTVE